MKFSRILLLSILLVLLSGCNFSLASDVAPPPGLPEQGLAPEPVEATSGPLFPLVPPDPANGELLYAEHCAACHGNTGLGDGPSASQLPNPVTPIGTVEEARQATPAQWYEVVSEGNLERFMPPFRSLSDRQRWDVVAYAFGLSVDRQEVAQGEEIYQAECAACHGEDGRGDGPEATDPSAMPDFQDQEYMASQSLANFYQAISEGSGSMPAFAERYAENERWAMGAYVRSLSFARPPEAAAPPDSALETPSAAATITETVPMTETVGIGDSLDIGTVSGIIENVTSGVLPPDLEVSLHGFDQMAVVLTETVKVSADGVYVFEDIEMPAGRVFLTTVEFEDVTYGSEIVMVEDNRMFMLPIQVYETSSNPSQLFADRLHMFFEILDENTMRVAELYIVSNPTEQTVVASEPGQPVIEFSLPEGATNLQFEDSALGSRYVETENGFGDTVPIRPGMGEFQILFSYEVPYDRKLDLTRRMNMPVNAVVILMPADGIKVKGDTIHDAGTRDMQGIVYQMYNGDPIAGGQDLRVTLSGRPSGGQASLTSSTTSDLVIGIAVFGVVLIGAGVWLYRRNAGEEEEYLEEEGQEEAFVDSTESAESVMDAILTLDDLYQDGELPEEAYKERRAELKERLRRLMDLEER